ncbi:MAG: efflux RND transporter periplasmic adaptor subunit, partial [Nitrospirae bacterium]|nr:efflux RND transporter periplasmic adaptor subunit [Nitrospirota bacterium]
MKRLIIITGIVLGLSVLAGCSNRVETDGQMAERPVVKGLEIVEIKSSLVKDSYDTTGTLRAVNTSTVSAKIMGVVKAIHAREGQNVKKGDILLEISAPDINAKVMAASEAVKAAAQMVKMAREDRRLAETTFERFKGLYEGKAVSEQEFDEMKTKKRLAVLRYEQALQGLGRAKAMLKEAESFLGYTVIRSPFDGVVAEKNIDIGSMTAPGMPLFIVEGGGYLVETPVSEGMLNSIAEGETVEVTIDSLGIKTTGRVTTIVH